ncbi:MAG: PQQ-binding-like beta-propeller repeat protein [Pirellulales bacterium]|nr:PQQ-binding-like beta-propeller repeat protein [Pirellulales bacterium]
MRPAAKDRPGVNEGTNRAARGQRSIRRLRETGQAVALLLLAGPLAPGWNGQALAQVQPGNAPALPPNIRLQIQRGRMIFPQGQANDAAAELTEDLVFPTDREMLQRLDRAKKAIDGEHFDDAVRLLGDILHGPEDYFFQPDRAQPLHRSLKAEAERIVGNLPPAGRQSYELQFGAEARRLLELARTAGGSGALADLARRYFHTAAGYEATWLLADDHLDHGRPLSAALCLKRLAESPQADAWQPALGVKLAVCWARAGMRAQAEATLAEGAKQAGRAKLVLGGEAATLPNSAGEYGTWLAAVSGEPAAAVAAQDARWLMFRGDPSRSAPSVGSAPLLNARWRMPTYEDPLAERILAQLRQMYLDQNLSTVVNLHPLVVDDVVLMRTTNRLLAVDLKTGKRLWWATSVDGPDALLDDEAQNDPGVSPQLAPSLDQRIWEDATFGTLASNGTLVFSIEDLPLTAGMFSARFTVGRGGRRHLVETGAFNRLAARNIHSGKLVWEIGGQPGDDALEQAGAFFLGPPLALGDRLYCLAEINSEIRLLTVDAETGKLEWSQQLALLERSIAQDLGRRVAGLSPSYADGVLVCPTGAGAVVAVDLTSRSLLWGYRYPAVPMQTVGARLQIAQQRPAIPGQRQAMAEAWVDSSITLAGGRCFLTPAESQELHCLDLLEGSLVWKAPREDGVYVAGVHGDSLIVVGGAQVRGYKIADGTATWPPIALTDGSSPSGRGFLAGDKYYLPVSSAEVLTIDLDKGQTIARSRARDGRVPGNLVAYAGMVLGSGPEGVDCFYQLDEIERQVKDKLAAQPQDAEALTLRGEILWHSGQLDDAIAALRRAHQAAPDHARARSLLVEALLEGLRSDFAKYQLSGAELETLLDDSAKRGEYLHYLAAGLLANGQPRAAFEACLQLVDTGAEAPALDQIDAQLAVRRDRWVQTQFAAIWAQADEALRAEMQRVVAEQFALAQAAPDAQTLAQFVGYFATLPGTDMARLELAERLASQNDPLQRELLVRQLVESREAATAARACRIMAELALAGPRPLQAATYVQRLRGEFADVACAGELTGRAWVESLGGDEAVQQALLAPLPWPKGHVQIERSVREAPYVKFPAFDLRGRRGPFFTDAAIEFDLHRRGLVGRDGLGNEVWRIALQSDQDNNLQFNQQINPAMVQGHLLVAAVGAELFAIDTLGKAGDPAGGGNAFGRILWRKNLADSLPGGVNLFANPRQFQFGINWRRIPGGDQSMQSLGPLGLLSESQAYFIMNRTLTAADLHTGATLWARRGFAIGSLIWGDRDVVAVVPPEGVEAAVLRAADGAQLGTCIVPPVEQRLGTIGRRLLVWTNENGRSVLELRDVWPDTPLWRQTFSLDAKAVVIEDDEIAVVEPQGRFVILSLPEGRIVTEQLLEPEENLSDIAVLRSRDHYILVANHTWQRSGQIIFAQPIPQMNPSPLNPLVNGRVYGFDRRTRARLWVREVESQGLYLLQPSETPMLVLAAHVAAGRNGPNSTPTAESLVLCLDKRTGETLHEERFAQQILYDVSADAQARTVALGLQQPNQKTQLVFKFTDEPPAAANEAPAGAETPASAATEAGS